MLKYLQYKTKNKMSSLLWVFSLIEDRRHFNDIIYNILIYIYFYLYYINNPNFKLFSQILTNVFIEKYPLHPFLPHIPPF